MSDRVIVYFPPGYRELWIELQRYKKKERADRLRFLATYGLACLKGSAVASQPVRDVSDQMTSTTVLDARRSALRDRLKASLRSTG